MIIFHVLNPSSSRFRVKVLNGVSLLQIRGNRKYPIILRNIKSTFCLLKIRIRFFSNRFRVVKC